jgi:serine/threonine protein kinase
MQLQRQSDKSPVIIEPILQIGAGGEARIYGLRKELSLVAKIYYEASAEKANKLSIMIAHAPNDPMAELGHASIAWPNDLLISNENIVGFLMPRIIGMLPIIDFYNPGARRKNSPLFSYLYLHRTARNLSAAFRALHESGYVIGDVSESNIFVSETSLVTLVDTDSFQVCDPQSEIIYRCPVGRPEFTPPELQGEFFRNIDRTSENDLFGLAVLIFMLLMEGTHPFSGVYQGKDDPPLYGERIASGHFLYSVKRRIPYYPAKSSPPFELVDPSLRELFIQCFEEGHKDPTKRPDAQTWQDALWKAEKNLITCSVNDQHRYGQHLKSCPWCKRTTELNNRDPFPSHEAVQKGLHIPPENKPVVRRTQPRPSIIVARPPNAFKRYVPKSRAKYSWRKDIRIWIAIAFILTMFLVFGPNALQLRTPLNKVSLLLTLTGHDDIVTTVALSPNGETIASGSRDGTVRLWNMETGDLIKTISVQGNFINTVAFSPNGSIIASGIGWVGKFGGTGGEVRLWDNKTGNLLRTLVGHEGVVLSVAFSPNGQTLASTGMDDTLRLWNPQTGELLQTLKGHQGDVTSVAFSGDGNLIATASTDSSVRVWNAKTGKMLKMLQRRYLTPLTSVAFSPSNRILASGCLDKTTRIWDLTTGGLQNLMIGHKGPVNSVAFTPDGQILASGSADNTIRLWSMSRSSHQTLNGHEGAVTSVAFSPDGSKLVSASKDRTIKVWFMGGASF